MQKQKIKIYLSDNDNLDELCLELLQKLNLLEEIEEGQAVEIVAPVNPFLTANIKLKAKVCQKLIQLRVKFIVRVEEW